MCKTMEVTDCNVIRFHLQVLYGITVKHCEKKTDRLFIGGTRVFGVPLESLERTYLHDFGLVPAFLVQACSLLSERLCTVGLFRKPGSLPRIKNLRAKLNRGEDCLPTALPYDVATLIKQFCRELPEPLFPSVHQAAFLKAQALPQQEDRTSCLQLLSCLLPARNASTLHFLFTFLNTVSRRCSDNLMTSLNLATVFAPCLLPPPDQAEMSESRLELRVQVLRTFIENPQLFGVIPKSVLDSMQFLRDSPVSKDMQTKKENRKRHSFTVKRAVKTVPWTQARSKTKLPEVERLSAPSHRPGLRRSLGHENFPNIQVFRSCLTWEEQSYKLAEDEDVGQQRLMRRLRLLTKKIRGVDEEHSPVLTDVTRLHLGSWKRRSTH